MNKIDVHQTFAAKPAELQKRWNRVLEDNTVDYDLILAEGARHTANNLLKHPEDREYCERPLYAGAARMLIDLTIATLNHRRVAPQLTPEVTSRAGFAADIGSFVAVRCAEQEIIRSWYLSNPRTGLLWEEMPAEEDLLCDADYLHRLVTSVFNESSVVAGGALRALRKNDVTGNHTEIIRFSSGLQRFAGIHSQHNLAAMEYLGMPYGRQEHYVVRELPDNEFGCLVSFSTGFIKGLQQFRLPLSGCPATSMADPLVEGVTLYQGGWDDIVDFLVPANATVDALELHGEAVRNPG